MAISHKYVDADYGSRGTVDFTEAEWAQLRLHYGLGETVTPVPDELTIKLNAESKSVAGHALGSVWYPNGTAGIWTFAAGVNPDRTLARRPYGAIVVLVEYDPADILETGPYQDVLVSSCTVVGIWNPAPAT